jgi:hypothetical protein
LPAGPRGPRQAPRAAQGGYPGGRPHRRAVASRSLQRVDQLGTNEGRPGHFAVTMAQMLHETEAAARTLGLELGGVLTATITSTLRRAQPLQERVETCGNLHRAGHQRADQWHFLRLLRARRERATAGGARSWRFRRGIRRNAPTWRRCSPSVPEPDALSGAQARRGCREEQSTACDLRREGVRGRRWVDVLRGELACAVPADCDLRGQDIQGRQARG